MAFGILLEKAVLAFVGTNLDEFAVLVVFFAQCQSHGSSLTPKQVVCGQLIGFTIIFSFSCVMALTGLVISLEIISLLGFVPLLLGIYQLYQVIRYWIAKFCGISLQKNNKKKSISGSDSESSSLYNSPGVPNGQYRSVANDDDNQDQQSQINNAQIDHFELMQQNNENGLRSRPSRDKLDIIEDKPDIELGTASRGFSFDSNDDGSGFTDNLRSRSGSDSVASNNSDNGVLPETWSWYSLICGSLLHANVLLVSATIIADGSEEIAVFTPLLAVITSESASNSQSPTSTSSHHSATTLGIINLLLMVAILYTCVFVQCLLAYQLVNFTKVAKVVSRYGKNIVPIFLIVLGLVILSKSVVWPK